MYTAPPTEFSRLNKEAPTENNGMLREIEDGVCRLASSVNRGDLLKCWASYILSEEVGEIRVIL